MAGGWTRDGAVQDQIDDTVKDAILRAASAHALRARAPRNATIAASRSRRSGARRFRGVRTCVACQSERDKAVVHSSINRRGSKDSQLVRYGLRFSGPRSCPAGTAQIGQLPPAPRKQILDFIATSDQPAGKREIARAFGLSGQDKIGLKTLLKDMADEGLIDSSPGRAFHNRAACPR